MAPPTSTPQADVQISDVWSSAAQPHQYWSEFSQIESICSQFAVNLGPYPSGPMWTEYPCHAVVNIGGDTCRWQRCRIIFAMHNSHDAVSYNSYDARLDILLMQAS